MLAKDFYAHITDAWQLLAPHDVIETQAQGVVAHDAPYRMLYLDEIHARPHRSAIVRHYGDVYAVALQRTFLARALHHYPHRAKGILMSKSQTDKEFRILCAQTIHVERQRISHPPSLVGNGLEGMQQRASLTSNGQQGNAAQKAEEAFHPCFSSFRGPWWRWSS